MECPQTISRVSVILAITFGLMACSKGGDVAHHDQQKLTIYSPAPPSIMLHQHNVEFGEALNSCQINNTVLPVALPKSINQLAELDAASKPYHLPIVTTIDFLPAIVKGGPDWHAYDTANADLKFVTSLHDVIFGVLAFDQSIQSPNDLIGKKIGAPPRPSAVRVYTEALLRDGWGILDEVEIVDILPPDLPAAIAEKRIDATTWSLMSETADGFLPMMPPLLKNSDAHWIETDTSVVKAINRDNDFKVATSIVDRTKIVGIDTPGARTMTLLSFRQGHAVWETTPENTVSAILSCVETMGPSSTALPHDVNEMAQWPELSEADVHSAAREFYKARGIKFTKIERE